MLDPVGPIGVAERTILFNAATIMLAIIVPTILATFGIAWWFRSGNTRATRHPDLVYSGKAELVIWSIPAITVVLLGSITWLGAHRLDPARPLDSPVAPLDIEVVSLDWKWLFIYPDQDVAAVNRLVVPTGTPLRFTLTSGSIMTVFFVPRFGSMIYVMNGMSSHLNLQVDQPGTYRGIAAQIAGDGFSKMHFDVVAMAPDAFATWCGKAKGQGPTLDEDAYRALSRQSTVDQPLQFGSVMADLYKAIVSQHVPPGPGPDQGQLLDQGQGGAQVSPRSGVGDAG
ncbi:MAG: COX aromatic rich motif-containing protein [Cypionkella sp.]